MSLLSIIIVNYKTPQLLTDCLNSVVAQQQLPVEIIIVDNFSQDDSEQIIRSKFPMVKWIQMSYNAGFARANNEGIKISTGDIVLLLNSDTLNVDGAVEKTYSAFLHSDFVACGVQLLNADGSPQISGNYVMKGGLNNLLPLPITGALIKFIGTLFGVKKPHVPNASDVVEVDWINGAFLMVKRHAIAKAGMMDEDFFLYAEEAEWCHRLKRRGRLAIYGKYKIVHLQGETSNSTFNSSTKGYSVLYDRKGLQIMLSNFVRIRKQFGIGWFLLHLLVYTGTVPLFFLFGLNWNHKKGFAKNISRLWCFAPAIISNKPHFYKVL